MRVEEDVQVVTGTREQIRAKLAVLQKQRESVAPKPSKEEENQLSLGSLGD